MTHDAKDWRWQTLVDGRAPSTAHAQLAVLMDIRDELKALNGHLRCYNFVQIPTILRGIRRKLPTPKPKRK